MDSRYRFFVGSMNARLAILHVGGLHHHYERRAAWSLRTKADQFSGPTAIR